MANNSNRVVVLCGWFILSLPVNKEETNRIHPANRLLPSSLRRDGHDPARPPKRQNAPYRATRSAGWKDMYAYAADARQKTRSARTAVVAAAVGVPCTVVVVQKRRRVGSEE